MIFIVLSWFYINYFSFSVPLYFFFFFSSRRRHTRFDCDWSSDVCSSDLRSPPSADDGLPEAADGGDRHRRAREGGADDRGDLGAGGGRRAGAGPGGAGAGRSEERRVGKEGRSRWAPYH